jgi:hypothetical protein
VFATTILGTVVLIGRRAGLLRTPAPLLDADGRRARIGLRAGVAGVMSLTAYLLILFAYSVAPLAAVAPLRESAIVLGAAWGSMRLGEAVGGRDSAMRIGAAALVVLGAVLVAIGESG